MSDTEDRHFVIDSDNLMSLKPKQRQKLLNFLIRWKRYDEALPIARWLSEDQPDGLLYRSNLVKVLAALGEFREAEEIVSDLEYRYPQRPYMYAAAGDLEMAEGDLPAALKHYLQMLQVKEKSPNAWRRLAGLYMAAGQTEKAHSYCKKLIEATGVTNPGRSDIVTNPGRSNYYDGLHPDVLRVLAGIHRIRGDSALADEIELNLAAREKQEEE